VEASLVSPLEEVCAAPAVAQVLQQVWARAAEPAAESAAAALVHCAAVHSLAAPAGWVEDDLAQDDYLVGPDSARDGSVARRADDHFSPAVHLAYSADLAPACYWAAPLADSAQDGWVAPPADCWAEQAAPASEQLVGSPEDSPDAPCWASLAFPEELV
jgi:hypothetical protein